MPMLGGSCSSCCGTPCCVRSCDCMCCKQVKWTLTNSGQSPSDFYGDIASNCYAYANISSGCIARATIRCDGYNPNIFFSLNKPQGCDTDCHVVKIEYCNPPDGDIAACVWTAEPTGCDFSSLTAEVYCPDGVDQPPPTYPLPRTSALGLLSPQVCDSLGGALCPNYQCEEPCGFPCPPGPTEWRIIDGNGVVWFAGDVEINPQATPDISPQRCSDPDDCDPQFKPKWILKDYPFSTVGPGSPAEYCPNGGPKAAAMYIGQSATLRLEVLGCGPEWTTAKGPQATIRPDLCTSNSNLFGSNPWETAFSWLGLFQGCNTYFSPPLSNWTVAPGFCECLTDPTTGNPVMYDSTGGYSSPPVMKCRHCNNRMGGECGSGLEYLGHGIGVRYTNRNGDKDGSNLWNWEDAEGNYPAGWLPTEEYFGGPAKTDTDIIIEGDMDTWRTARLPPLSPPQFGNVTIKQGGVTSDSNGRPTVTLGFDAETITVDNARLSSSSPCRGNGSPCKTSAQPPTTFRVGSLLYTNARGSQGNTLDSVRIVPLRGSGLQCVFDNATSVTESEVTCDTCTLKRSDPNVGFGVGSYILGSTINGNVVFENRSTIRNSGSNSPGCLPVINGNVTLKDISYIDRGTINGSVEVYNQAGLGDPFGSSGDATSFTVNGNATLYNSSLMGYGTVTGTATFNDTSVLAGGTVDNDATFNDESRMAAIPSFGYNGGTVTGTATFNDSACYGAGTAGTFVPNQPPAC